MIFAFSKGTSLSLESAFAIAKRTHFDAVELNGPQLGQYELSTLRQVAAEASIEIAATNFGDEVSLLPQHLELTAAVKSKNIRIKIDRLLDRSGIIEKRAVETLVHAGDIAADFGIMILMENQPISGSAVRLWHFLDRLNHPAIACAWNSAAALRASENPTVAIPMLNLRIRYVGTKFRRSCHTCPQNDGSSGGIGFNGYVLVNAANHTVASEAELEQSLNRARSVLQDLQMPPTKTGR